MKQQSRAFTIVEVVVVIAVIGILAAISIVAYNGMQENARKSTARSLADQYSKKIAIYDTRNAGLPTVAQLADAGVVPEGGYNIEYKYGTDDYCLSVTKDGSSAHVNFKGETEEGLCDGHTGLVGQPSGSTSADNIVLNPGVETNTGYVYGYWGSPISRDTSNPAEGRYGAVTVTYLTDRPQGYIWVINYTSNANETYNCSFALRGTPGVEVDISGRAYTAGGGYIREGLGRTYRTLTSNWQPVNFSFTTPANTGRTYVQVRTRGIAPGTEIRMDNLFCTKS